METHPMFMMGRLNIAAMSTLTTAVYGVNTIHTKIPKMTCEQVGEPILKFT